MALTNDQQDHLSKLAQPAQLLLDQRNIIEILNYEWAGIPDFNTLIDQAALDEFTTAYPGSPLADLNLNDVNEVEYVAGQINGLIDNKFPNIYALSKASN